MAGVFIYVLVLINELGLGAALVQVTKVEPKMVRQTLGLVYLMNAALFAVLFLCAPLIAGFYDEPRLTAIVRVSSLQFLLSAFSIIPRSMLQRNLDYKRLGIIDLVGAVAGSLTTLALALMGAGVWGLVIGSLVIVGVKSAALMAFSPPVGPPDFSLQGMGRILHFGTMVTLERVLWFASSNADILIVGKLLGKEMLGFYSVAMELASLPVSKLSDIISQVAFSAFARMQEQKEKVAGYFLKACRILSLVSFPVFVGIAAVSEEIVLTFLGEKWEASILPLRILCLIMPLRIIMIVVVPLTQGLGRPALGLINMSVAAAVRIPAFLIGAHWGLLGICLAWVAATPVLFTHFLVMVRGLVGSPFHRLVGTMVRPALLSGAMYAAVVSLRGPLASVPGLHVGVRFAALALAGAATYGLLTALFQRATVREMADLVKRGKAAA
jgi:O-antigen/teichoic acid export membrane protein